MRKFLSVVLALVVTMSIFLLTGCGDDECGACNGSGYYQKKKCPICKGSGHSDYDPYEQYKSIGK